MWYYDTEVVIFVMMNIVILLWYLWYDLKLWHLWYDEHLCYSFDIVIYQSLLSGAGLPNPNLKETKKKSLWYGFGEREPKTERDLRPGLANMDINFSYF